MDNPDLLTSEVGLLIIMRSRGAAIIGGGIAFLTAVFLSRWATLITRLRINSRESISLASTEAFLDYRTHVVTLLELESSTDLRQARLTCGAVLCFLSALLLALPSGILAGLAAIRRVHWFIFVGVGLLCASTLCVLLGLLFAALELRIALSSATLDSQTIVALVSSCTAAKAHHTAETDTHSHQMSGERNSISE